jgi:NhaP-type Na+/H+ or K+/H+ antiporter
MLSSILWILLMGFFGGQIVRRLGGPPLIGMILVGMVLGPQIGNVIEPGVLESGDSLRTIAVMVILMRAGLGLDREKLAQQSTVALRLGFLPATTETVAIALTSIFLFDFDFPTGLLLGCVIGAESPAVIVPGMLRLKSAGWGVTKGIPDAILTGSALSDVLLLLVFSLLLSFLGQATTAITLPGGLTLTALQLLPIQVILQIALGVLVGYLAARLLVSLLTQQNWTQTAVQDVLIAAGIALLLVVAAAAFPYFSGYLAAMSMGFFLIELDAPLARRLRGGFDSLWTVAEIVLFVLMGASIQLRVLGDVLLPGVMVLAIGTLIGRSLGWYLSTLRSNWNWRERLFLLPGNSAKATVQAAIGGIPLAQGIVGGETILAIAALSILITAPLGAWAIPTFAPKLLERGEVDPTKINLAQRPRLLAAIDGSPLGAKVLVKVAELARRSDAEVIVLHVINVSHAPTQDLQQQTQQLLSDIRYRFVTTVGSVPEQIVQVALAHQATEIVIGKRGDQFWQRSGQKSWQTSLQNSLQKVLLGSVSQAVLETSPIPVVLIENE